MPWDVSDAERKDQTLIHALADMSTPMGKAEQVIAKAIDRNFSSESAAGEAWAPLAASTQKERARKGYGPTGPILERTKTLRESMKGSHDNESAAVGPSEDVDYAKYHVSEEPRSKIPLRDFLVLEEGDMREVDEAIVAHLEAAGG